MPGGRLPLWGTGIDTLGHLGVGVSLYFRLLKDFSIMLLIMSIIAAPMTYFFFSGSRVPSSAPNPLGLAAFSLGNIGTRCGCVMYWCCCRSVTASTLALVVCCYLLVVPLLLLAVGNGDGNDYAVIVAVCRGVAPVATRRSQTQPRCS